MSKGTLQVAGSSLFLKSKYGLGYHIHIDPINRDYSVSSEARSQVINKLIGNTEYSVTIVAVNSVGQSKPSEALIFKTESHSVGAPFTSSFTP